MIKSASLKNMHKW